MLCKKNILNNNPVAFFTRKKSNISAQICQEDFCQKLSICTIRRTRLGFGTMGTQDKAKHLATLYLEDISDFIVECVDANFFSRYAERLGQPSSFDEL
jgi:hypothetical protein